MKKFYEKIDMRSHKEMVNFLSNHYRYDTANSWNISTSYANNVKIYNIELDTELEDKLYNLICSDVENYYLSDEVSIAINEFEKENGNNYTAGFNGRNDGYLVLYKMDLVESQYKSYCTSCYHRNCKTTEHTGTKCGNCGENKRVNYTTPLYERRVWPGKNIDMNEDFEDKETWDMYSLKERVKLVQSFDKLTDKIVNLYVEYAKNINLDDDENNEEEVI